MLRCNHYLEPSPQGASERKIPICLVNSVFNSRGRAPARNRRGKERQWDLPIALQIKRGRFESAPELAAPATTIGSIWVGSIHRRGRRQRQIATQASACCCHHKVPAFTNAQRPPHQFAPETISSKRNEHDRTQTKAQQKSAALVDVRRSGCRFASCRVHQPSLLRSFGRASQSRFQLAKQRRLSRRSRKAKADASHGLRVAQPCAAHQGKACPA
jgi:hypothetical protein